MKRFYSLLIGLSLLVPTQLLAQQDTTGAFTLERCISYAIRNSINAQNASIDQRIALAKVRETTGIGLPQISASGSVLNNPLLPRFFTTYVDAAHRPPGSISFIDDAQATQAGIKNGDVVAAKNFFQLQSSGNASITATENISASYFVGLSASRTFKELAVRNYNQTKEQIIIQVSKAYYAVIINKERAALFTNNIARVDSLLKNTVALNKNGFAESIDVDRIQVNLNNLVVDRDNFLNISELSIALLKFQMNYPMEQTLHVDGTIQDIQLDSSMDPYKLDWDYKVRPDYQVLETNRKLQELTIKNKYAAGMPSLSIFGTVGYSTQSPTVGGVFKTNTGVKDGPGIGPDKWYNYSQVGLTLNVPIFSGGQRHYQLQQEKLNLMKIQNNFKTLKNSIDLEVTQSSVNFENALHSLNAQKSNMELAAKVARVTKIKYEQGVGSNIEVIDAENSLRSAQTNYYNALYNVMVAKVDIDKAYGKILNSSPN